VQRVGLADLLLTGSVLTLRTTMLRYQNEYV
jgi:hypothetical protein